MKRSAGLLRFSIIIVLTIILAILVLIVYIVYGGLLQSPYPYSSNTRIPQSPRITASFKISMSRDCRYMNLTLEYTIENILDKPIEVLSIEIPGIQKQYPINMVVHPGEYYSGEVSIYQKARYTQGWAPYSDHAVTFKYWIVGEGRVYEKTLIVGVSGEYCPSTNRSIT